MIFVIHSNPADNALQGKETSRNLQLSFPHLCILVSSVKNIGSKIPMRVDASSNSSRDSLPCWECILSFSAATDLFVIRNVSKRCRVLATTHLSGTVVTASFDKAVSLWNAATGAVQLLLDVDTQKCGRVRNLSTSPDGRIIATAHANGTALLWNTNSTSLKLTLGCRFVNSLAFSPDGKWVATANDDCTTRLWEVSTGELGRTFRGHTSMVLDCAFSCDSCRLVTASYDRTAKLWDANSSSLEFDLIGHVSVVNRCRFSNEDDRPRVITASLDATARLWDVQTGCLHFVLQGHTHLVTAAIFSNDGKRAATASNDGTARVWDAFHNGSVQLILRGHGDSVEDCAFSKDDKCVLTASADATARLWDAVSGTLLGTFRHADRVSCCEFCHVPSSLQLTMVPSKSKRLRLLLQQDTGGIIHHDKKKRQKNRPVEI